MGKLILRILFILSLSFNAAFLVYLVSHQKTSPVDRVDLNLSAEQQKQVQEIRLKKHRQNEAIKREISRSQESMMSALRAAVVDRKQVNRHVKEINHLQQQLQQNTVEEILELKRLLDSEQCTCLMDGLDAEMKHSMAPCTKACCNPPPGKETVHEK